VSIGTSNYQISSLSYKNYEQHLNHFESICCLSLIISSSSLCLHNCRATSDLSSRISVSLCLPCTLCYI